MALSIYQKSIYLMIFFSTGIHRRLFKKDSPKLKDFKIKVYEKIKELTTLMDSDKLQEENIKDAIEFLTKECHISFGQAQKPINVILKYHYHLFNSQNERIGKILHCPFDSQRGKYPNRIGKTLKSVKNKDEYEKIQKDIDNYIKANNEFTTRIKMDEYLDKDYLIRHGWNEKDQK